MSKTVKLKNILKRKTQSLLFSVFSEASDILIFNCEVPDALFLIIIKFKHNVLIISLVFYHHKYFWWEKEAKLLGNILLSHVCVRVFKQGNYKRHLINMQYITAVSYLPILRDAAIPSNLSNACKSVFIAINSTPETPVSIILITAFPPPPPTPITFITHGDIALLASLSAIMTISFDESVSLKMLVLQSVTMCWFGAHRRRKNLIARVVILFDFKC